MQNLRNLDLLCYYERYFTCEIKNQCFDGLSKLEQLRVIICSSSDDKIFNGLNDLKKLKLHYASKLNPKIFHCLDKLVELDMQEHCDTETGSANIRLGDISLYGLKTLNTLRIQLSYINSNYFKNFSNLKILCIEYLAFIEENAFKYLETLNKLSLPSNKLKKLKSNTFVGLINLKELHINNNYSGTCLKKIERGAFKGLISLEQLSIDISNLETYDYIFEDLSNLKRLNLINGPNMKKIINDNPFKYLDKLESIKSNQFAEIARMLNLNNLKEIISSATENIIQVIKSCNLQNLISIDLEEMNRSKEILIDSDFFKSRLNNLKKLNLCGCGFNRQSNSNIIIDSSSFDNLHNLEYLNIENVLYSDTHDSKDVFKNLNNLVYLRSYIHRFDYDAFSFANLNILKHLDLRFSVISFVDKMFENLINLEILDLSSTNFTNLNKLTFYGLTNLKQLHLKKTPIKIINSNSFIHLTNLIHLDLFKCFIAVVEVNAFAGLSKLQTLILRKNKITSLREEHFNELSELKKLDITDNPFAHQIDVCKFYKNLNKHDLDFIIA